MHLINAWNMEYIKLVIALFVNLTAEVYDWLFVLIPSKYNSSQSIQRNRIPNQLKTIYILVQH